MNAIWHYYDLFGLAPKLGISLDDLQHRFYGLSRKLHPDRFIRKSEGERQQALDASSELNDAYRVLKDPLKRVEYVLGEEGFDIGEQRSKDVPPELLEEVFELNMAIEESDRPQLETARQNFASMLAGIDAELERLFSSYDAAPDRSKLAEARGVLNRRRYIRNLVNEVEKELSKQNVEL